MAILGLVLPLVLEMSLAEAAVVVSWCSWLSARDTAGTIAQFMMSEGSDGGAARGALLIGGVGGVTTVAGVRRG
jgi:hypothetical protein